MTHKSVLVDFVYGTQVTRMLLKQARVPKLVKQRTTDYEARDFKDLLVNPFDEREWPSYMAEIPVGKEDNKEGSPLNSVNPNSSDSFDKAEALPTVGR